MNLTPNKIVVDLTHLRKSKLSAKKNEKVLTTLPDHNSPSNNKKIQLPESFRLSTEPSEKIAVSPINLRKQSLTKTNKFEFTPQKSSRMHSNSSYLKEGRKEKSVGNRDVKKKMDENKIMGKKN